MREPIESSFAYRDILFVAVITLAIQISSLILTSRFVVPYPQLPSFAPAGQSVGGSVLNSLILIVVALVSSLLMIFLIRKGRERVLRFVLAIMMGFGTLTVTFTITLIALTGILPYSLQISASAALALSTISLVSLLRKDARIFQILASVGLAIYFGTSLAVFLKPPTVIILPIAFGIYDLYAVFKGPLKVLVHEAEDKMEFYPMVIGIGDLQIGLGDLVFYAMVPSVGLLLVGLEFAIILAAIIQGGMVVTLFMLRRFSLFPGLPIPLFLATGVLAVALYA